MIGRKIRTLATAAGVLLTVLACNTGHPSGDPAPTVDERAVEEAAVDIRTFQFLPTVLEVSVGSAVTWRNHDDILHTVTSGKPGERDGRFDSSLEQPGSVYSFSFAEPGTYSYFCARHEFMRGQVIVKEVAE